MTPGARRRAVQARLEELRERAARGEELSPAERATLTRARYQVPPEKKAVPLHFVSTYTHSHEGNHGSRPA
jgi:hypothetical protein